MESHVCKKPALAGVCAAQRQIFGPLRGPKIETLGRLSEKSLDFFDSLSSRRRKAPAALLFFGAAARGRAAGNPPDIGRSECAD